MINLQLYILNENGQSYDEVELYDNETVSYTQSLQDVRDISKVFSDFTRTFNVPASRTNNIIFKHFYNYFIDGFDPKKRHKAKIFLNYELYKEGYIKLEGATTKDNRPFTYRLTFFGSGVILKDVFREKKLSSLSYLISNFKFDYTSANVKQYLQDGKNEIFYPPIKGQNAIVNPVDIKDAIVFPLISHTDRMIYDSNASYTGVSGEANLANVTNGGLSLTELKPAIRVHAIIKAIEAQYKDSGIEFTTDFFNDTNLPYYNLYLWLHTKTGGLFTDQEGGTYFEDFTVVSPSDTGATGVGIIQNDNTFTTPDPAQVISNPKRADKQRSLSLSVETTVSGPFTVIIYDEQGNEFSSYTGSQTNGVYTPIPEKDAIEIDKGSYRFAVRSSTPSDFTIKVRVTRPTTTLGKREFNFTGTAIVGADTELYAANQMPDITILGFLTGLFKMFNLTAFQNDEGKIVIQTLDQFYADSDKVYDITPYLDKDTITVDSIVPYRQVNFSFEGRDTFLAATYEDLNNKDWGGLHYKENDNNLGTEYKIVAPFEHMLFEKLTDANDSSDTGIQIGWSADEKQEPTIGKPLLFYAVSKEISEPIKLINFDSSTTTLNADTKVYMPSNSLELGDDLADSININFASEINEYAEVPFKSTLFNQYYKNYILDIFDKQRRLTNTSAYLPQRILSSLKLNDKVLITDRLYKINKLTTDFQKLLTNLELINTTAVQGQNIVRDTIFRASELVTADNSPTVDSTIVTVDDTIIAVDNDNTKFNDGYVIIKDSNNGTNAVNNTPPTSINNQPVEVTPPTLFDPHITVDSIIIKADTEDYKADANLREVTASSFKIGYQVKTLGKIGTADNIDEYGFLYSTTSDDLLGTDVDDIAAVAGVTKVDYVTASNNKRPAVPFSSSYQKNNATSATTYYFRFYGRTNTDLIYAEADALSEIEEITTA